MKTVITELTDDEKEIDEEAKEEDNEPDEEAQVITQSKPMQKRNLSLQLDIDDDDDEPTKQASEPEEEKTDSNENNDNNQTNLQDAQNESQPEGTSESTDKKLPEIIEPAKEIEKVVPATEEKTAIIDTIEPTEISPNDQSAVEAQNQQ